MPQANGAKDTDTSASVNNVPPEWLVHYAELVEERGDSDLAERIRDHIQDSTGLSYQEITSQQYT